MQSKENVREPSVAGGCDYERKAVFEKDRQRLVSGRSKKGRREKGSREDREKGQAHFGCREGQSQS